jgi:hypothetical protein
MLALTSCFQNVIESECSAFLLRRYAEATALEAFQKACTNVAFRTKADYQ